MRLVMCGLFPADELKLWSIVLEPHQPSCEPTVAAAGSTSGQAQMEDIRRMLQQSSIDASLHSDADPKRRFMHALATAALQQPQRVRANQIRCHLWYMTASN